MNDPLIRLQFPNFRAAYQAFDTLQELGYRPDLVGDGKHPELTIHLEKSDVQSALEITAVYGGQLFAQGVHPPERFEYDLGEIGIPAHTVTEDFTDLYASGSTEAYLGDEYDAVREGYRDSIY